MTNQENINKEQDDLKESMFNEEKYQHVIQLAPPQADMSAFKNMYQTPEYANEYNKDITWLANKKSEESAPKTIYAKALEAVTYYAFNNEKILGSQSFAVPGSEYDDYRNAVDVVCGFQTSTFHNPVLFTLDTTTTSSSAYLDEKFNNLDTNVSYRPDIPGSTTIKYCSFYDSAKNKHITTTIRSAPCFIVGIEGRALNRSVNKFDFPSPGNVIHREDPEFTIKILLEILVQARAHCLQCANIRHYDDPVKPTHKTFQISQRHEEVYNAAKVALIVLSAKNDGPSDIDEIIKHFSKEYNDDNVFSLIMEKATERYKNQRERILAFRAAQTSANLTPPNPAPDPA